MNTFFVRARSLAWEVEDALKFEHSWAGWKESVLAVMPFFRVLLLGGVAAAGVVHYPPSSTNVNNLTFALHGTGRPGIFDSSTTPDKEYGTYNWCNMPHVRAREYKCAH